MGNFTDEYKGVNLNKGILIIQYNFIEKDWLRIEYVLDH